MHGFLDDRTAFLTLDFGQGAIDFLVDTGFNGTMIVGAELFDPSRAEPYGSVGAELASEQTFEYPTFIVRFEWMGEMLETLVLVGPGTECLLGAALLEPHRLEIDYGKRTVELIRGEEW